MEIDNIWLYHSYHSVIIPISNWPDDLSQENNCHLLANTADLWVCLLLSDPKRCTANCIY